ncbi:transcriptional regulator, TetR family [Promicromonospora umidemergens]|uniref:TetR/AcrR family transcriptional regulator n=1 Tax=Promicromonospora umidemergens TaxID=629679 RepID=A0ABP8YE04_9MICO|nr:TetR/AcrR family transcriptional regulator [Promicromonospora umidemergens]MCP2286850.1 transcriptional regulator, TetR family [Promicromonospora umidemergens]
MTPRRQQILSTAADLFAARGFHGVSMGDIGAAVGVSGPALYKHFASKDDILGQCLLHASDQLLAGARELLPDAEAAPGDALEALIARHADFALDNPALIVVQEREWGALGADTRAQVRKRQLAYVDVWCDALRPLRPDLSAAQARAAVQAAFGLLNSTPHSARIGRGAMHALLTSMAHAALLPWTVTRPGGPGPSR